MLNGGYVMLDLTAYGEIGSDAVNLSDKDLKSILDVFKGKPLLLKHVISDYVYVGFNVVESDDIKNIIYIPITHYDINTLLGYYSVDVQSKTISFIEYE